MQTGRLQFNQQLICFDWLPPLRIHERRLSEKSFVGIVTFLGMVLYSAFCNSAKKICLLSFIIIKQDIMFSWMKRYLWPATQSNYSDRNVFFDLLCSVIPLKIRVKETCGRVNVDALYIMKHWPTFFCFEPSIILSVPCERIMQTAY